MTADNNSGRHRAPDGEANTAYIPRISDASPDGVPGGPLAPPVGLGSGASDVRHTEPPAAAAVTEILQPDDEIRRRVAAARTYADQAPPSGEKTADEVSAAAAAARLRPAEPQTPLPPGEFDFFAAAREAEQAAQATAAQTSPAPAAAAQSSATPAAAAQTSAAQAAAAHSSAPQAAAAQTAAAHPPAAWQQPGHPQAQPQQSQSQPPTAGPATHPQPAAQSEPPRSQHQPAQAQPAATTAQFSQPTTGAAPFSQAQPTPSSGPFGQSTSGAGQLSQAQPTPSSSPFGQSTSGAAQLSPAQPAPSSGSFGQATAGTGQFSQAGVAPATGQFGQAGVAQATGQFSQGQPAPDGGQVSQSQPAPTGQGWAAPGQLTTPSPQPMSAQTSPATGRPMRTQTSPAAGQPMSAQSSPAAGQAMSAQSSPMAGQAMAAQTSPAAGQAMPGQTSPAAAHPVSVQAQAPATRPGSAQPVRPQVTHTTAPVSPIPHLQPPAETQQLPAPVGAANRQASPQTVSAPANQPAFAQVGALSANDRPGPPGYGPSSSPTAVQARTSAGPQPAAAPSYGSVEAQTATPGSGNGHAATTPGYGSGNGQATTTSGYGSANGQATTPAPLGYGSTNGQSAAYDSANSQATTTPSYGSGNGHSAPELNARATTAYPATGYQEPEPARVGSSGGSAYGSPAAAPSNALSTPPRTPDGLTPSRRSSEGGYQPNTAPTSLGTQSGRTVPGRTSEDAAATRQLPAPDVSKPKTNGVWDRPETNFIEQPSSADLRQDPSVTAVIRTADAPTGLLPSLRTPTRKVGVPGAAAEAAKAAADPDAVLGAVPVTEVRPGTPTEDDIPVEEEAPKRGEKVVKLRPEQTEDGYESVYSKLTRPTVGSRLRTGIRVSGELMITFGLIVLLFAGYEIYGNGAKVQSEQDSLNSKLDQDWADPTVGPAKAGPAAPGESLVGRLYIPKFAKEWVVVNGVLPDDIKYAPGHYPSTAMPGQIGNFSVAGHRIPKIFWRINELKDGDVIGVETRDTWYIYKVYGQEIVKPDAVQVVEPVPDQPGVKPTKAVLTLTTCNPKGNNYQRLIVHAQLASQVKRDASKPNAGMPAEMNAKY